MNHKLCPDDVRSFSIFADLDDKECDLLMPYLQERELQQSETLFKQGEQGEELFLVCHGEIEAYVQASNQDPIKLASFTKGDFFGEMVVFEDEPRSASCIANQESSLLALSKKDFYQLKQKYPSLIVKILYRIQARTSERLKNTGKFLSDLVHWGENARRRAIIDEMTGLYNRRYLDEILEKEFHKALLKKRPLTLIMVDLDHFGKLNDLYGPDIGDQVILEAVSVFKSVFREKDILSRYGGDEFTFLLPATKADAAYTLADQACKKIAALEILKNKNPNFNQVTTSQGLADFPSTAADLQDLMRKADQALYAAKEAGRNQVFSAQSLAN